MKQFSPRLTRRYFYLQGGVLLVGLLFGIGCSAPRVQSPVATTMTMPPPQSEVAAINESLGVAAAQSSAAAADYQLGADDLLHIAFYNVIKENLQEEVMPKFVDVRVSHSGNVPLPLLGEVPALGLTTATLEQELQRRYRKFILDPQVSVHVLEYHSQRVSVFGAVKTPGVFELSGPKTLVDLLAMAGGLDEKAGRQVHLSRQGQQGRESFVIDLHTLTVDPSASINQVVYGGDVITVPRAGSFFVDGAVRNPGAYILDRSYTLTQALATAGGADPELANAGATQIFRGGVAQNAEPVTVNVPKVLTGEIPNPEIHADDVIVVPVSMTKYVVQRFFGKLGMGAGISLTGR